MSYLEKLFVFTLTLSFLVMAFMFALYFDVGDMIYGRFAKGQGFRSALAESAVALLEFQARTRAPLERGAEYVFRNGDFGVPETQRDFVGGFAPAPVARESFNDLRRAELRRMGVTNEAYVEMEAQAKDRGVYEQVVEAVDALLEKDDFERALQELQTAIATTNPQNLYVLRDLWAHQMNVCTVAGKPEDAKQATFKYAELQERILKLRQAAGAPVTQTEWDRLAQLKSSIEGWFSQVARGEARLTGSTQEAGPSAAERLRAREQLDGALKRGEVSREEYDRVARELGL